MALNIQLKIITNISKYSKHMLYIVYLVIYLINIIKYNQIFLMLLTINQRFLSFLVTFDYKWNSHINIPQNCFKILFIL